MKIESFKSYNAVLRMTSNFFPIKLTSTFYYISEIVDVHIFIPVIKKSQIEIKAFYEEKPSIKRKHDERL